MRVEIQDAESQPLPGFASAGCQEVYGDDLDRTAIWAGNPELGVFSGKLLQLQFEVEDVDFSSFRFRAGV